MSWREQSAVVGGSKKEEEKGTLAGALGYAGDVLAQMPRQAGLAARNVLTGVTGIPAMGADLAMSGANLLLPQNMRQQMPSEALQNLMTQAGLPEAQTGLERGLGMVQAGMAGSRIDPLIGLAAGGRAARGAGPMAGPQQAPPATPAQQTFAEGRGQGYVLPPASIRQDAPAQIIEGFGGKRLTGEIASQRNQDITNRLAARAVGLSENQPLTAGSLKAVRNEAGEVYAQIRDSGRIAADQEYKRDLAGVAQEIADISEDFKGANIGARQEIMDMVKSLNQEEFGANAAVTYLRKLRDTSVRNMKAQEPERNDLGLAQRKAAVALENAIMRHLRSTGKEDLASQFSQARTTIAKAHDIEAATDFASGNVDAAKFARLLSKGEPLSGELELIGRMGAAFPQATRAPRSSVGVSALDIYGGVGAAGLGLMTQSPELTALGVAMPFARRGAIGGMLSSPIQNVLTRQYPQLPGRAAGAAAGLLAAEDEEEQRRRMGLMR
jgi:hypothetical protein